VNITVRCSKGVYVRSLCADIGDALGMGAHVTALQRTRSGRFRLAASVTLEELAAMAAAGALDAAIMPIDEALAEFPPCPLQTLPPNGFRTATVFPRNRRKNGGMVRLHGPSGGSWPLPGSMTVSQAGIGVFLRSVNKTLYNML
jgi:tRNA pseudouridine55 synthase